MQKVSPHGSRHGTNECSTWLSNDPLHLKHSSADTLVEEAELELELELELEAALSTSTCSGTADSICGCCDSSSAEAADESSRSFVTSVESPPPAATSGT